MNTINFNAHNVMEGDYIQLGFFFPPLTECLFAPLLTYKLIIIFLP